MTDPFRNYDRWKLMSPEDEEDEREAKRERERRKEDEADDKYDRWKDEH